MINSELICWIASRAASVLPALPQQNFTIGWIEWLRLAQGHSKSFHTYAWTRAWLSFVLVQHLNCKTPVLLISASCQLYWMGEIEVNGYYYPILILSCHNSCLICAPICLLSHFLVFCKGKSDFFSPGLLNLELWWFGGGRLERD